jgi:hypothetical protein
MDFSIIENANSSKIKPSDKRFRDVKFDDIDNFLKENEKENTRKKTTSDMNLFRTYLVQTGEKTEIENQIPKLGHRNSKNYQTYLELTYSRRIFGGG